MRLPGFVLVRLRERLMRLTRETPDEIVGPSMRWRKIKPLGGPLPARPFLKRWFVLGKKNRWCNIYLHCFLRDDEDRALHDHPWWNFSILLRGQYIEHTIDAGGVHRRQLFRAGDIKFRRATAAHRVELTHGDSIDFDFDVTGPSGEQPAWSLFITGPVRRKWGFHCPEAGWRASHEFHDKGGCD